MTTAKILQGADDGTEREIFIGLLEATLISSEPEVVDASSGVGLVAKQAGVSTVTINYLGFSDTAEITVSGPPRIALQPQSQSVVSGDNVTFRVKAGGSGPLEYQWRFRGADIPSATSDQLVLSGVQASQSEGYSVVVSNTLGSVTSDIAVLTILNDEISQPSVQVPITDGVVNAIATQNGVTYFGGSFSKIGSPTGSGLVFKKSTGDEIPGFPMIDGPVLAAISDGAGGFYIGGSFQKVGGVDRPCLARILGNGKVDATFNADVSRTFTRRYDDYYRGKGEDTFPSSVNALALSDGKLYVGGKFKVVGGMARAGLACLDEVTGIPSAWNPGVSYDWYFPGGNAGNWAYYYGDVDLVQCLLVTETHVFVGGPFKYLLGPSGKVIRAALGQIDRFTGLATSWDPNFGQWNPSSTYYLNNDILIPKSLAVRGNTDLFVGGGNNGSSGPNKVGGLPRSSAVAKIDMDSGTVLPWNPKIPRSDEGFYSVGSITVVGDRVFAGVDYISMNSINVGTTRLFAVNAVNGVVDTWNPKLGSDTPGYNVNGSVAQLVRNGNELFVVGDFDQVDGKTKADIVSLDTTSGGDTGFAIRHRLDRSFGNRRQTIKTLAISGENVFIGGDILVFDSHSRNNLAAMSTDTGEILPWKPSIAGSSPYPSQVYSEGKVRTLYVTNGTVYVGGAFTKANVALDASGSYVQFATDRNNLAAFDAVSGEVTGWNPNVNAPVYALASVGSNIFAGGDFSVVNSTLNRNFLASFDPVEGKAGSWNPDVDNLVRSITTDGTSLYAGGYFQVVNGNILRRGIACFDQDGRATGFNANVAVSSLKAVRALAVRNGTLYAGGDFLGTNSANGNTTRNYAAAFDSLRGCLKII